MEEPNLLLDTSVLINYLRNHQPTMRYIYDLLSQTDRSVAVSGITEFELYTGKSMDKPQEKLKVDLLLNKLIIFPLSSTILRQAGEIKRKHPSISPGDAIIAATSIESGFILITPDKDFSKIPELKHFVQFLK